ncbi:MAG: alpha/beta fold hydrolase [bacterium]
MSEQFIERENGRRIFYREAGPVGGAPVILLHGAVGSSRIWKGQIKALAEAGFHVFAPDLAGHGRSDPAPLNTPEGPVHTLTLMAADVHVLATTLSPPDGTRSTKPQGRLRGGGGGGTAPSVKPVIVGWSMGSFILQFAMERFGNDWVRAIVLVNGCPGEQRSKTTPEMLRERVRPYFENRAEVVRQLFGPLERYALFRDDLPAILSEAEKPDAEFLYQCRLHMLQHDFRPNLPKIGVPVGIFHGVRDETNKKEQAEFVARTVPRPHFVWFEKSGHSPFLTEPENFNKELITFIRSLK